MVSLSLNKYMPRKEKEKRICLSTLKERGWTPKLIDELLPPPRLVKNPHYSCAPEMKTWAISEVEEAEKNQKFVETYEKKMARKKKKEEKHEALIETIADVLQSRNPADDYPQARSIKRHFILMVGETNTGKTYEALEALKKGESGVYLAPLRLLAMEVQENLLASDIPCSMLTGEESNIIPDAKYMSSTVEMLDLEKEYEIGIIDECQLLADPQRGGAWTRAILGLCAPVIYLCLPPHALKICIKLIESCNDTYEIRTKERKTSLEYIGELKLSDIQKGDAVIVFSRKGVIEMADTINRKCGLTTGLIYGALPYKNRREQVERFRKGEIDVIVSTDAIGMGMNLPIQRVIFAQTKKFNGYMVLPLSGELVKQVAGRAGRYGMYDTGYVALLEGYGSSKVVKDGLFNNIAAYCQIYVPFPEKMLEMRKWASVEACIKTWRDVPYPECFRKTDMTNVLAKAYYLRKHYPDMDQKLIYRLSTVPFDYTNNVLHSYWTTLVSRFLKGKNAPIEYSKKNAERYLEYAEETYKKLDLCYSFCRITGMSMAVNPDTFEEMKEEVVENINNLLLNRLQSKQDKKSK